MPGLGLPDLHFVTLNLFQGPFLRMERRLETEGWMLKQVQHDGEKRLVRLP